MRAPTRCQVVGHAGRAQLLFAVVRCGASTTVLGFDSLAVAGHLTWTAMSDGEGGEVRDTHVRSDRVERGVGLALRHAAQEVAGVRGWSGVAVPDNRDDDAWLESTSATAGQHPVPVVDVSVDELAAAAAAGLEVHVVFCRAGEAVIMALAADTLAWVGHLTWTLDRPGGRLGGERAGLTIGEVQRVDTRAGLEHRGIARRMYQAALQAAAGQGWPAEIDHNPSRTSLGDAWPRRWAAGVLS